MSLLALGTAASLACVSPRLATIPLAGGATLYEAQFNPEAYAVHPVLGRRLETTQRFFELASGDRTAVCAVNGGFFNHRDGVSASYVTLDEAIRSDPHANALLVGNPRLKAYLPRIFNRTEFRILSGTKRWAIAPHFTAAPKGERIRDALQGGPRLLPELGLEAEGFVAYGPPDSHGHRPLVRDGIGAFQPTNRTALGLKPDGSLVLAVVVGPSGSGLTILALRGWMRKLGCQEAMALDGGSSSTLVVRTPSASGGGPLMAIAPPEGEARVRSALVVFRR